MDCQSRLEQYFRDNGVEYATMRHVTAYTAQEVAAAQNVPGKQVAKVVMAIADARIVMLVMPASYRIDFTKLKNVLGAKEARLAQEAEFSGLFPDCDIGAMPPFGNLYNVPVYMDRALTEDPAIVFQAGTHRDTVKIAYKDYAARPAYRRGFRHTSVTRHQVAVSRLIPGPGRTRHEAGRD